MTAITEICFERMGDDKTDEQRLRLNMKAQTSKWKEQKMGYGYIVSPAALIGGLLCLLLALNGTMVLAGCSTMDNQPVGKQGAQADNSTTPVNDNHSDQLMRVIVRLDVADIQGMSKRAAGLKDPTAAKAADKEIQTRIATVADRVLKQIEHTGAKVTRRYRTLPLLALQATPQTVTILKTLPEVLAIESDTPDAPTK